MIPLARVQFREAVQSPGPKLCIYPRPETVFVSVHVKDAAFQRSNVQEAKSAPRAIQRFLIWRDGNDVVLKHPDGESEERIPWTAVSQSTPLPEAYMPKKEGKAA